MQIGVDLGGSKIEAAALGPAGEVLLRHRCGTPQQDYDGTVAAVRDLVLGLEAELERRCSVGVGIPGTISPQSGLVKNANSTWLIGKPLDRDLSTALGRPLRLDNDANCFALSEAVDGAAAGKRVVFGVILGTGVGGGLVVDRQALTGAQAIAGEWGHNPLPWPEDEERPGPQCYCGKRGCIETFLSGPGLSRDHAAASGESLAAPEIAERAAAGDAAAQASMERYYGRLARGLASIINVVDPDAIVLGGGLSNLDTLYREVPPRLPDHVFSDGCVTPLLQARHGDSSGVRGAAWLWRPEELSEALGEAPERPADGPGGPSDGPSDGRALRP